MRHHRTFSTLFLCVTLATACAAPDTSDQDAGHQDTDDQDMGEAHAMEQNVEAPACYVASGTAEEAQSRPSPLRQTAFAFEGGQGLLCYGAPSARGREIMGGLLVYGSVERIGANEPTTIHLTASASVGGVSLEPGSYSIYAIANDDEWEFFINSDWQRWGIPITASIRESEVGNFTATPTAIEEMVETLTYRWEPNAENTMGDVVLEWEHTQVRFQVRSAGM